MCPASRFYSGGTIHVLAGYLDEKAVGHEDRKEIHCATGP